MDKPFLIFIKCLNGSNIYCNNDIIKASILRKWRGEKLLDIIHEQYLRDIIFRFLLLLL